MIRIWGRIPFQPSSHPPPPIRPEEPYWQRLFQQQILRQQQKITAKQQQQQQGINEDVSDTSKVQSSATPHSASIHPGLVQEQATNSASATVPISTGAESISIWGTGPSDDSGGYIIQF